MSFETETPHKIKTFKLLYFQNKVDQKNSNLETQEDDEETYFLLSLVCVSRKILSRTQGKAQQP